MNNNMIPYSFPSSSSSSSQPYHNLARTSSHALLRPNAKPPPTELLTNRHQLLCLPTTTTIATVTPKLKPRKKPDTNVAGPATAATPPCSECGKCFASWKALFGHMRCHPERPYRGINPPPSRCNSILPAARLLLSPDAHFTNDEYDVAESLVLLANGPPKVPIRHKAKDKQLGSSSSRKSYVWDLNLPPPVETWDGYASNSNTSHSLDLKLGI